VTDKGEAERLEALWAGDFGDEYSVRNRDDGAARRPFWEHVLTRISPSSALEVGCNVGGNLLALAPLLGVESVAGVDVNASALATLAAVEPRIRTELAPGRALPFADNAFDLVFTTGVLIHQPDETLDEVIDEIVRCAARYVLCGEYFADSDEEVAYRGHRGALFRRDFGALYEARGLQLVERGFLARDGVWDDLTYWIFRSVSA
jgi:pseudaminic acid biosynthesis-associated methylase